MNIEWRKIEEQDLVFLDSWSNEMDKKMLCMESKTWQQTANDIEKCLKYMPKSQFRNAIGFYNGIPVCAIMFGIECSGEVLRIYNLLVNPLFRSKGIGKQALKDTFSAENKFGLNRTFSKVVGAVFPENNACIHICKEVGLNDVVVNDEYYDFSRGM